MKDPSQTLIRSNLAVVIKDKFPKAKHHFLVLPLEDIPSIFKVSCAEINVVPELTGVSILPAAKEALETARGDGIAGQEYGGGAGRDGGWVQGWLPRSAQHETPPFARHIKGLFVGVPQDKETFQ